MRIRVKHAGSDEFTEYDVDVIEIPYYVVITIEHSDSALLIRPAPEGSNRG